MLATTVIKAYVVSEITKSDQSILGNVRTSEGALGAFEECTYVLGVSVCKSDKKLPT